MLRPTLLGTILLLSSATFAAKPPPPPPPSPPDIQVAWRTSEFKGTKLVVSTENGSNQMKLYGSAGSFTFDLAPRSQKQIAIVDGGINAAKLKLLTYDVNTSGVYVQSSVVDLADARSGSRLDFSSNGRKIAYACCWDGTNEKLAVYDLDDNSITYWATQPFFWDIAWFRNDASIAYSTERQLYEVPGAGATPQFLFVGNPSGEINVDSSRTDPDALVVSYNDTAGNARIGRWKGTLVNPDLANSARSWQGTYNCTDTKLAFLGAFNTAGTQAFYVRDLSTNTNTLVAKAANILLQFWPTC